MPNYRVYFVTDDGHISGPPHVIEGADEQEAIGKAAQAANAQSGVKIEHCSRCPQV